MMMPSVAPQETSCKLPRHDTRPRIAGLATLFTLTLAPNLAGSEEPPSSLVPAERVAEVRLGLEQRVVRECHPAEGARPLACAAREQRTPAKTSITLRPIREASLKGRHAGRAPVTWAIDSAAADPGQTRSLVPGLWRLEWAGTKSNRRSAPTRAPAADQAERAPRRCEAIGNECKLVLGATERQVDIRLQ